MVRPLASGASPGVADIFDEINEDLRGEQWRALAKRYGWMLGVLVLLVVGGVGGYEFWKYRQGQRSAEVAIAFSAAMRQATGDPAAPGTPPSAEALAAAPELERIAGTAPEGYRTLARLRLAALRAGAGDLPAALALWDEVSRDGSADPDLRGLADLLWAERQIDSGDPAVVAARIDRLADPNNTWHALAQEAQALLALRRDDPAGARAILTRLTADTTAPDDLRQRAQLMLALPGIQEPHG